MTKRYILWTSLGQFVLEKKTSLEEILAETKGVLTLNTITDGWDKSTTTLNLSEVKIFGYYEIEKVVENKEA